MKIDEIDLDAIDGLLGILPEIRGWKGPFGHDVGPEKGADGLTVIGYFAEDDRLRQFRDLLRDHFWDLRDHPDWSLLDAYKSLQQGADIDLASLDQVRRWLFASVCADRWADGALAELFEQGRILAVLERLDQLRRCYPKSFSDEQGLKSWALSARDALTTQALSWQRVLGIPPAITSRLSELDAALILNCPLLAIQQQWRSSTAVKAGHDFEHQGLRVQVKANRPTGKPGSKVTLVAKPKNVDWDVLIWIHYDTKYRVTEAWEWPIAEYRLHLADLKYLRPKDLREGRRLDVPDYLAP